VKAIILDVDTLAAASGHTVYRYSNNDEAIVELPGSEIAAWKPAKRDL
jgi:hypothetical protein